MTMLHVVECQYCRCKSIHADAYNQKTIISKA